MVKLFKILSVKNFEKKNERKEKIYVQSSIFKIIVI